MAESAAVDDLILRLTRRRAWRSLLRASGRAAGVLAVLYAALVVGCRWWLGPTVVEHPAVFTALALTALAYGVRGAGFGDRAAAARALDAHADTHDLFLTRATLGPRAAAAALAPLVEAQARARASSIDAGAVAGPRLLPAVSAWTAAGAVVALSLWLAPRAAPAPKPIPRTDLAAKASARIEALRKREVQAPLSPPVDAARAELAHIVAKLQPQRQAQTRVELRSVEKKLAELWQQAKNNGTDRGSGQGTQIGSGDHGKRDEWKRELAAGKVEALQRQVQEITAQAKTAAASGNAEAAARARAAAREVKAFARAQGAKDLDAAMSALLDELAGQELDAAALARLGEQAGLELEALRQSAADLQALEQALRTEQLAATVNDLAADLPAFDADAALDEYESALREQLDKELADLPPCEDCDGGG